MNIIAFLLSIENKKISFERDLKVKYKKMEQVTGIEPA